MYNTHTCVFFSRDVRRAFQNLENELKSISPAVDNVLLYIRNTWFTNTLWKPSNWTIYRRNIRKNNDVVGWHTRLNQKIGRNASFYILMQILYKEACLLPVLNQMVHEGNLSVQKRKKKL